MGLYLKIVISMLILATFALPTAVQAQTIGSRDNPVPIGSGIDMGENWQITVLNVIPNATNEAAYGSPHEAFVRDSETELFIAKIQAKYIGPGSSHFESDHLSAVGSASVGYTSLNSIEGDMVPGYIPYSQEVFTGGIITGNVLWMIPPKDADHLVMYDRFIGFDKRTYMALY